LADSPAIARSRRFRPKRRLGQHFLRDPRIIRRLIALAGFDRSDRVLEIGPGLGALTFPLAASVRHLVAVEKDAEAAEILKRRLSQKGIDNVTLIQGDILKLDLREMASHRDGEISLIGNLPYNISSPLLEKLIHHRKLLTKAVLTFQIELARRLSASPGGREYGAITVLVQYHARLHSLMEIPREAFHPRPKVGSMVLELDFTKPYPKRASDEGNFRKVVKAAFSHRRKTLLNSLRGAAPSLGAAQILEALEACGIDPGVRAEALAMDDFLRLSESLRFLDKPPL